MSEDSILRSENDFYWYKKRLDLDSRYDFLHEGTPEKYPCKVVSTWQDDLNGPYWYSHRFYYRETEKITCDKCGHTKSITLWTEILE